ncbi:uncharacterized protein BDZ99DRAFT_203978 [Mytilinidion resinicola]|uniref:F-box domain-containing protein n=1 Tax=Mytilinidion resinicola TaxID=574789 RepID=A0A6A6Y1C6_9PEZI|nr:uncharacterized protein BDZ99DRAFT_203978 [Mytilinidion resinicola]KAF2802450.1 hypothetical protein BDZ99DRAFT_203978 [Mytilinidion resinicola]
MVNGPSQCLFDLQHPPPLRLLHTTSLTSYWHSSTLRLTQQLKQNSGTMRSAYSPEPSGERHWRYARARDSSPESSPESEPSAAAQKVGRIVELVEEILQHLPFVEPLSAKLVCEQWHDTIGGSLPLQRQLFFRPVAQAPTLTRAVSFEVFDAVIVVPSINPVWRVSIGNLHFRWRGRGRWLVIHSR